MKIGDLLSRIPQQTDVDGPSPQPVNGSKSSFAEVFSDLVSDVNTMQNEANDAVKRFTLGEATDLHDVMIATEKAKTSLDLLMEIRNKAIDAYRELMRTTV